MRASALPVATRAELDAAIAGYPQLVDEWLDDCVDALVSPLLTAVRLLDLEVVVIDADLPAFVVDGLIVKLERQLAVSAPEARDAPKLRRGLVGRAASAIGAAILPLHLNYGPTSGVLLGAETLPEPVQMPG